MDTMKQGRIEVKFTADKSEIEASQRLRYRVFFEEEGATPAPECRAERRDFDEFDPHCEHLVAIDRSLGPSPDDYVVGTYRMMRKKDAAALGKWYSQTEFDVEKFGGFPGEVLELGRACVAPAHRTKETLKMLWNALAAYMFEYDIKVMFGCGSFPGLEPEKYRRALSYLYYNCRASGPLEIHARGENARPMDMLPESGLDTMAAMNEMPPLIRGYIRAGAKVSSSLWIDRGFNCFDVCIIFEMKDLKENYLKHYEREVKG